MKKENVYRFVLFSSSILASLLFIETYLRLKGVNASYDERNGNGSYTCTYPAKPSSLTYTPLIKQSFKTTEFVHVVKANSLGFNDSEWSRNKNKKRIFCLGDSFTAGFGSTNDSSYPAILQRLLGDSFEVCNAGVPGCDIVAEYELLQKKLLPYKPDYLLISINQTDIVDIITNGGSERFDTTKPFINKNPWWNGLYAKSYLFRFFIHQVMEKDYLFLTKKQYEIEKQRAEKHMVETIEKFHAYSYANGVKICFVVMPMKREIFGGAYELQRPLLFIEKEKLCMVNMLDYFAKHGIESITAGQVYWPVDLHYNNKGYALLANAASQNFGVLP